MHDEDLRRVTEWLEGRLSEEEAAALESRLADDSTFLNAVLLIKEVAPERPARFEVWRMRRLVVRALREPRARFGDAVWLRAHPFAAVISTGAVALLCGWLGFRLGAEIAVNTAGPDRPVVSTVLDDDWGL